MKNRETYESLARIKINNNDTVTLKATLHTPDNAAVRGFTHIGDWTLYIDDAVAHIKRDGFWPTWVDMAKQGQRSIEQTKSMNESEALTFIGCMEYPVFTCDNIQAAGLIENLKPGEYVLGVLELPEGIAVSVHLHEIMERIFRRSRLFNRVKNTAHRWEYKFPSRLIAYNSDALNNLLTSMEKAVIKKRVSMPSYTEETALDKIVEEFDAQINAFHMAQLLRKGDCVELCIAPNVAGRGLPFKVTGIIMETSENSVSVKNPHWDTSPTWVQLRFVDKVNLLTPDELNI